MHKIEQIFRVYFSLDTKNQRFINSKFFHADEGVGNESWA